MNSKQFGQTLALPDSWQRKALNFLREGKDVVLHAPTGAGKTFVFEQLIESGWKGKAVYTYLLVLWRTINSRLATERMGCWFGHWRFALSFRGQCHCCYSGDSTGPLVEVGPDLFV